MKLLKPSLSNMILPLILIVMYIIVSNYMYSYSGIGDKYMCDIIELGEKTKEYGLQNNSLYNQTRDEMLKMSDEWQSKMPDSSGVFIFMGGFLENINPFFPTPCTMTDNKNYCRYYISRKSYDCIKNIEPSGVLTPDIKPYKKVNIFHHLFAMSILFLEGYIVSVLLVLLYNIIKNRSKKSQKPKNFGF